MKLLLTYTPWTITLHFNYMKSRWETWSQQFYKKQLKRTNKDFFAIFLKKIYEYFKYHLKLLICLLSLVVTSFHKLSAISASKVSASKLTGCCNISQQKTSLNCVSVVFVDRNEGGERAAHSWLDTELHQRLLHSSIFMFFVLSLLYLQGANQSPSTQPVDC